MAFSVGLPCKCWLFATSPQAGTAPNHRPLWGPRSLWGVRPSSRPPFPHSSSFLPPPCPHPSHHHPDPSLASYPDMLFPLRSLRPAKSLVSSHSALGADALISLPGQSPSPASLPVSQHGSCGSYTVTGRLVARMWGSRGFLYHLRSSGWHSRGPLPRAAETVILVSPFPSQPGLCEGLAAFLPRLSTQPHCIPQGCVVPQFPHSDVGEGVKTVWDILGIFGWVM